jgi:tetratricopeptide (TPR) repeat protein
MTLLTVNPYKVGPPVTGTDFYGRTELLSKVCQALIRSNVVLLQGQRRIGKTSFLQRLPNFLSNQAGQARLILPMVPVAFEIQEYLQVPPLLPIIFDIQRYVQDTLPHFQQHLANTIAKEIQLPVPSLSEWESNPILFRDVWLPQVFERLGKKGLVIIVDEFDNLGEQTANRANEELVPFLGQLVAGEQRLKWIFTVGRHIGRLPIQYDPIVSPAVQFRLSFLSKPEADKLIVNPASELLTYEPTAIERIYQLTSGHPHLTQALCSEVFERVVFEEERDIATLEDVDAVIPHVLKAYEGAIASIVRVPALEERVLAAVAQLTSEEKAACREEIIELLLANRIRLERDELTDTLDSLLEWELLVGDVQGVRIAIEIIRIWITKNVSLEPSREEELDIQYILAQSRYEFAQKARQAGKYDLATKDYQEALEYIPNHCEALRGLAEAYRLSGNLAGRADTLQKLYLHDRNVMPELVEALADYAQQSEKEGQFSIAAEQYDKLLKLQNRKLWRQRFVETLIRDFEKCIEEAERILDSEEIQESSARDKLHKLKYIVANRRENIQQTQAVIDEWSESKKIQIFLKKIKRREWTVFKRIDVVDTRFAKNWKSCAKNLLDLEKAGIDINSKEKIFFKECASEIIFQYKDIIPFVAMTLFLFASCFVVSKNLLELMASLLMSFIIIVIFILFVASLKISFIKSLKFLSMFKVIVYKGKVKKYSDRLYLKSLKYILSFILRGTK